jgi:hypothetical protein
LWCRHASVIRYHLHSCFTLMGNVLPPGVRRGCSSSEAQHLGAAYLSATNVF